MKAIPNREKIQNDILNAAINEFSLNGFLGASTQAIAKRANLTKSQLHYYIGSKETLYKRVLRHLFDAWEELFHFDSANQSDPISTLENYIDAKLQFVFDYPELSRIFTVEVIGGGVFLEELWPEAKISMNKNLTVIERWISDGLIRPLDGRLLIMNIWALTQYYADYALQVSAILDSSLNETSTRLAISKELKSTIILSCSLNNN